MMMRTFGIAIALLVMSSTAQADPAEDIKKLVDAQLATLDKDTGYEALYAKDAVTAFGGKQLLGPIGHDAESLLPAIKSHTEKDLVITLSRDGQSAWLSFTTTLHVDDDEPQEAHVSQVAVKTSAGWKIAATMWTEPVDNATANKVAVAGTQRQFYPLHTDGMGAPCKAATCPKSDTSIGQALSKLVGGTVDATAAARNDFVTYGSAPKERTLGGSVFAKAWTAAWAKKVKLADVFAQLSPSKTTGWAYANLTLAKQAKGKAYKLGFRVLFVFDQDDKGVWSLAHANFATLEGRD